MQAGCFPNRWAAPCTTADKTVIYSVLFILLECLYQRATGTQTSVGQSCKHTRALLGTLHGETWAGSREDTKMAGPVGSASKDKPSKLHSHQKMFHLQIRLSPNAPTCSLCINHSSFCCKNTRNGALGTRGGDGRQDQVETRTCSHPSPNLTPNPLWIAQCREYLRVTQKTYVFLHWKSLGEKARDATGSKRIFLQCGENQGSRGGGARELLGRSRNEWEVNQFWESFGEL